MKYETDFPVERALIIQKQHLAELRNKLDDACYEALESWALASNAGKTDGYDIFRGDTLDQFVENWKCSPLYTSKQMEESMISFANFVSHAHRTHPALSGKPIQKYMDAYKEEGLF